MKRTLLLFSLFFLCITLAFGGGGDKPAKGGRCTGSAYCTACKNCSKCAHCNAGGGVCGVCHPPKKKPAPPKPKPKPIVPKPKPTGKHN